jgi:hypothetical protein
LIIERQDIVRDKILNVIQQNPKTYKSIINNDAQLMHWIEANNLAETDHLPSRIYSAVYQESNICQQGNKKKFTRFSTGFGFCAPANACVCNRQSISKNVSKTKNKYSDNQRQLINHKRSNTMMHKYGVEYNSQRADIKNIWTKPKIKKSVYEKLISQQWLHEQYVEKNRSAVDIADELGVYYSTVIDYCRQHNFKIKQTSGYSLTELQVSDFAKSLGVNVENNTRHVLDKKEIDIFIPSHNLGIEINGLYWHSYGANDNDNENKHRHLDKTEQAEQKGITLLHITDWEWKHKNNIIKSIIKSKLQKTSKIYARKTQVQPVSSQKARSFLDQNHIQGACASSVYLGLYHNNQLVMMISAGKSRFNQCHMEIHRLATINDHTVVGGASKLLSALKKVTNDSVFVCYCDRDKSNGNVYHNLKFNLIKKTSPGYFWTDGNEVISRYKCQKHNLAKWLKSYDCNLSEAENMFRAGYRRYWNSGNLVFFIDNSA